MIICKGFHLYKATLFQERGYNIEFICIFRKDMTQNYTSKENYITIHANPEVWKMHANYNILCFYKDFIKGKVADYGCNHGACTLLLLENNNVTDVYGVDMNEKALDVAYKTASEIDPKIHVNFVIASLLDIPLHNEIFDTIISFHTLEHIYPKDATLFVSEVCRTLKPGGYFIISIPYQRAYPDPAHVAFYDEHSLSELFETNGFQTIQCIKDDRWKQKDLLTGVFMKLFSSF